MGGALGQGERGGARVREPSQSPRRSPQAAQHITLQAWLQARGALGDAAHLTSRSPSTHHLPPLLLFLPHSLLYLSSLNSLVHSCPRTSAPAIPATYNALPSDLHTMGPSCHQVITSSMGPSLDCLPQKRHPFCLAHAPVVPSLIWLSSCQCKSSLAQKVVTVTAEHIQCPLLSPRQSLE